MDQIKRRAIFSLSAKGKEDVQFANDLMGLGFKIVSSGGTYKFLKASGIAEVIEVTEITKFPEILDDRVKTLNPLLHGGVLAMRTPEHEAELKKYGIERFEIIYVDIYHVWDALNDPDTPMAAVMKMFDIGGPTMLRGAAKNHDNGTVPICDKADCPRVLKELRMFGRVSLRLRQELSQKVLELMARYDDAIARFFARQNGMLAETIFARDGRILAYSENKSEDPGFLLYGESPDPLAMRNFDVVYGNPSYISIADGCGITHILRYLAEAFRRSESGVVPYIAVEGKHSNPCGIGVDFDSPVKAARKALMGNVRAGMGGEFATNFDITDELGHELLEASASLGLGDKKWGLDIILAPGFSEEAVLLLSAREKRDRRLLANSALKEAPLPPQKWMKKILSGDDILMQRMQNFILTPENVESWVNRPLFGNDFIDLTIAWVAAWNASSNTVAIAKDGMLIGLGAGQQDRVECARLCVLRAKMAGHDTTGSVFASDAFFPFAQSKKTTVGIDVIDMLYEMSGKAKSAGRIDYNLLQRLAEDILKIDEREGTEILRDAGCKGGVVPADGIRLEEVKTFFAEANMSVGFLNKIYRGFSKHA
jgi:phosphoribosylaminoimidazolecarboxamide formyltransferase / IMP cyclohydrolase